MDTNKILQELQFKAIRSGGAGGQHVNKVSSKVVLTFDLNSSEALSDIEKERIILKLNNRLTKENFLLLQSDESRSQHKNKEIVIDRFLNILTSALKVPKNRKKTKPSKSAVERRLKSKLRVAQKKASRSIRNIEN